MDRIITFHSGYLPCHLIFIIAYSSAFLRAIVLLFLVLHSMPSIAHNQKRRITAPARDIWFLSVAGVVL